VRQSSLLLTRIGFVGLSLAPGFNRVDDTETRGRTVSTVWPRAWKPLKRSSSRANAFTRLKPGA